MHAGKLSRQVLLVVLAVLLIPACGHPNAGTAMPDGVPVSASALPDADFAGAQLVGKFCGQCHGVPAPTSRAAATWRLVVERMVLLMKKTGKTVPGDHETELINTYLLKHAGQAGTVKLSRHAAALLPEWR
ncbi:MAG: hypothetical protein FD165_1971 [Gammaproteobacteria bacterium]|nr:MAG: hypothetical protein FD165_1971 [Gammaproteobacteria bacterium]